MVPSPYRSMRKLPFYIAIVLLLRVDFVAVFIAPQVGIQVKLNQQGEPAVSTVLKTFSRNGVKSFISLFSSSLSANEAHSSSYDSGFGRSECVLSWRVSWQWSFP